MAVKKITWPTAGDMSSHPQEAFACRGSPGAELRVVPGWQERAWILNWTNPSRAWPVRRTRKRWRPRPRIGSSDDHPGKQLLPVWGLACLSSQRRPVEPMPKSRTRPELRTAVSGELASRCKPHHNSRSKYAQIQRDYKCIRFFLPSRRLCKDGRWTNGRSPLRQ